MLLQSLGEGRVPSQKKLPSKNNPTTNCVFYIRTGYCKLQKTCPYIHDKSKIALCKKFLKGKCDDKSCFLTHAFDEDRMPTCTFFLHDMCTKSDCPYRHVKVAENATVCADFLRGFCSLGLSCPNIHTYNEISEDTSSIPQVIKVGDECAFTIDRVANEDFIALSRHHSSSPITCSSSCGSKESSKDDVSESEESECSNTQQAITAVSEIPSRASKRILPRPKKSIGDKRFKKRKSIAQLRRAKSV